MADNNQRSNTSTQIRNLYSPLSYLNIKFYNTNLSFQFHPFESKDATGRNNYNQQRSLMTTVNWDGAFSLFKTAMDIIEGREAAQGVFLSISCASGATLILDRKPGQDNQMETLFVISKNNETIPFKFSTQSVQVKENNQMVTKIIECGLGTFAKTINGYLEGINSDRHLDKYTDDYVKSLGASMNDNTQSNYSKPNYQKSGGRNYGRKPYYNNNYNQQQSFETPPNQQNMSSYQLPQ